MSDVHRVGADPADHQRTYSQLGVVRRPCGGHLGLTEVPDADSTNVCGSLIGAQRQIERYYFTYLRVARRTNTRLVGSDAAPPRWRRTRVVRGRPADPARGYIADDGTGIDSTRPAVLLTKGDGGIWEGGPREAFETFKGLPYMYRIVNAQGRTVFRTDIFSRSQIGRGTINPAVSPWPGTVETLDGTVSCSVVIDADVVRRGFASTRARALPDLIPAEVLGHELTPVTPTPTSPRSP